MTVLFGYPALPWATDGPDQTPHTWTCSNVFVFGSFSLQSRPAAAVAVNAPLTRGAPARKLGPLQHIQNLTQKTKEGLVVARDLNPADPAGQFPICPYRGARRCRARTPEARACSPASARGDPAPGSPPHRRKRAAALNTGARAPRSGPRS